MKITMCTVGSTGDVRPYVLLGQELKRRGHDVKITTFAPFENMITEAGLRFHPLPGDVVELMSNIMDPNVSMITYLPQLEKSLKAVAPQMLDAITASCQDADALCCAFFGSLYYSIAEKQKIPCIQTQYYPMDPSELVPIASAPGQAVGKLWNRATYRVAYLGISAFEKRFLTKWRRENGMSQRGLYSTPDYRIGDNTIPVIYATSPLVLPRSKEWGANIHISGFWEDNEPCTWQPPQDLVDFLNAGEQPIYIGFGSMVSGNMQKTFATVLRAIHASGVRAVVNLGWGGKNRQMKNTSRVYFGDYIPHAWLFPRVKAVVHHGGAGTTAAGLRAGKPTLVVPFGADQPFWGHRVRAIGCGPKPIPRNSMNVYRLTKGLLDLTTHQAYQTAAEEIGERLRHENGLSRAADIIEETCRQWRR